MKTFCFYKRFLIFAFLSLVFFAADVSAGESVQEKNNLMEKVSLGWKVVKQKTFEFPNYAKTIANYKPSFSKFLSWPKLREHDYGEVILASTGGRTLNKFLESNDLDSIYAQNEVSSDDPFEDPFASEEVKYPPLNDPWEGFNRSMFWFNDNLYVYFLKPVALTYREIIHEDVRIVISNLFDTAAAPAKLVSSILQGDFNKSGRVISRTVINILFGWGGMLDVAGEEYGIKNVNEDFGQALGNHLFPPGPYLVLPFLGPSTLRDTFGRVVDSFLNPIFFLNPGFVVSAGLTATNMINETSFRIKDIDALREDFDPYANMRNFYHQFREKAIEE